MKWLKGLILGLVIGLLVGLWFGVNIGRDKPFYSNPFEKKAVADHLQNAYEGTRDSVERAIEQSR